jgi:hypothetical protein
MTTSLPPSSPDRPVAPTQYRKPRADLYTLMLVIALVAILIGILFLCLYNNVYNWEMKGNVRTSMIVPSREMGSWLAGFFG